MSKIFARDDFKTQNWSIEIDDVHSPYMDLFIGFTDEEPIVKFKNLQFSYELKLDELIKQRKTFPPNNVKYIQSDQFYLVIERLLVKPDKTYQLKLWAKNKDIHMTKTFNIYVEKPKKPFESWIWDSEVERWKSPTDYPDDGEFYIWDEENQNWALSEKNE